VDLTRQEARMIANEVAREISRWPVVSSSAGAAAGSTEKSKARELSPVRKLELWSAAAALLERNMSLVDKSSSEGGRLSNQVESPFDPNLIQLSKDSEASDDGIEKRDNAGQTCVCGKGRSA
jgi:hypothetical protein